MLSPSLSHLFERARTRFGLEVEVIDSTLRQVYPDSATALTRMIESSPDVRRSLLSALAGARTQHLDGVGVRYQLFPLRRHGSLRQAPALVAIRQSQGQGSLVDENRAWPELARAILEADLSAADALIDEQQQSRRLRATLRFLRHLAELDDETQLGSAIVQAVAIWFDVDGRIFHREADGDFILHTALPGVRVEDSATRLRSSRLGAPPVLARQGPIPEWGVATEEAEVVLVPFSASGRTDWVLALIGSFPRDAEPLLEVLACMAGIQLEAIRARRQARTRAHFHAFLRAGSAVHEVLAVRLVRELADITGAAYASLVLNRPDGERRLVSLGTPGEQHPVRTEAGDESRVGATESISTFPLAENASATLVLRSPAGGHFVEHAELATRAATEVLQSWLVGAYRSLDDVRDPRPQDPPGFANRIDQELERAKRFDLRLSLVLVRLPRHSAAGQDAAALMEDTLRRELRGSDVLGMMSVDSLAALLTHTDHTGSSNVVGRLRRKLGEAADRLGLTGVTVGQAAFSPDCCTADALVSRAETDAQPVTACPPDQARQAMPCGGA